MAINSFFIFNSILLGVGLAMDAFSVSLVNGLLEPQMSGKKACGIAGVYAFFQAFMPFMGWIAVNTVVSLFYELQKYIPWITLIILCMIGLKMLIDGIKNEKKEETAAKLSIGILLLQALATSIDALSVGLTMSGYGIEMVILEILIIAGVTFGICRIGLFIGKKIGDVWASKALILGGCILIFIGIELLVRSFF